MNTVSLRHATSAHPPGARPLAVEFIPWCDSTNALVASPMYASRRAPWALATFDQRAGRGRQGRTWENRPGRSLALTLVWQPRAERRMWGWYSLAVALALGDLIGEGVQIKWPNDVLSEDQRKVAGILAEVQGSTLAIGVGVNLTGRWDAASGLESRAATVSECAPRWRAALETSGGRERWARELAARMGEACAQVEESENSRETLRERYTVSCITVGRRVWVDSGKNPPQAQVAVGVDRYGHLLAQGPDGLPVVLTAADVHLLAPPSDAPGAPAPNTEKGT